MWYDGIFEKMEALYDAEQSKKMATYMQNQFEFLGLKKPALDSVIKPYMKAAKKMNFDWNFVFECWKKPYREAQYTAVGYVLEHQKQFEKDDIQKLETLITSKSWWDTVDMLDSACGTLALKYPELKEKMLEWSVSDNIWLRRAAIDFQQKYKENTDKELLSKIIINNLGSKEFFINKAIGWSLRDYSKVNPDWVRSFIEENELSSLSRREALKYI